MSKDEISQPRMISQNDNVLCGKEFKTIFHQFASSPNDLDYSRDFEPVQLSSEEALVRTPAGAEIHMAHQEQDVAASCGCVDYSRQQERICKSQNTIRYMMFKHKGVEPKCLSVGPVEKLPVSR